MVNDEVDDKIKTRMAQRFRHKAKLLLECLGLCANHNVICNFLNTE